jgi:hypothetical protein
MNKWRQYYESKSEAWRHSHVFSSLLFCNIRRKPRPSSFNNLSGGTLGAEDSEAAVAG